MSLPCRVRGSVRTALSICYPCTTYAPANASARAWRALRRIGRKPWRIRRPAPPAAEPATPAAKGGSKRGKAPARTAAGRCPTSCATSSCRAWRIWGCAPSRPTSRWPRFCRSAQASTTVFRETPPPATTGPSPTATSPCRWTDMTLKRDFRERCRHPRFVGVRYFESVRAEEFVTGKRYEGPFLEGHVMRSERWDALLYAEVPARSVEIMLAPAFYERYLRDEYADKGLDGGGGVRQHRRHRPVSGAHRGAQADRSLPRPRGRRPGCTIAAR